MINEYKLVETTSGYDLENTVEKLLDQGYKLHGPLVVSHEPQNSYGGGLTWLRQVVVKGPNT
jgi:hypothetical protein